MGERQVLCVVLTSLLVVLGQQPSDYYMDTSAGCNSHVDVGETVKRIHARSNVPPAYPPSDCRIYFESAYDDTAYRLQVTIASIEIGDCSVQLIIYDHEEAQGKTLRQLGCGTKSTDIMYSSGRFVTLKLTRAADLYQNYDFTIEVVSYTDEDDGGYLVGNMKIAPYVIGIIVVLLFLLVAGACLLCVLYRNGRLPGMKGYVPDRRRKKATALTTTTAVEPKSGYPYDKSMNTKLVAKEPGSTSSGTNVQHFQKRQDSGRQVGRSVLKQTVTNYDRNNVEMEPIKGPRDGGFDRFQNTRGSGRSTTSETKPRPDNRQNSAREKSASQGSMHHRGDGGTRGDGGNRSDGGHRSDGGGYSSDDSRGRAKARRGFVPITKTPDPQTNDGRAGNDANAKLASIIQHSHNSDPSKQTQDGGKTKTDLPRAHSGIFEVNPDEEGYIYSYDQLHLHPDSDDKHLSSLERKTKADARKRAAAKKAEAEGNVVNGDGEKQDNGGNGVDVGVSRNPPKHQHDRDQAGSRGDGTKTPEDEALDDGDLKKYGSMDLSSEPGETKQMRNPIHHGEPKIRATLKSTDDDLGSETLDKKGRMPHRKNIPEASGLQYGIPPSAYGNQDPHAHTEDNYPYTVGPNPAISAILSRTTAGLGPGPGDASMYGTPNHPGSHHSPHHGSPHHQAAWVLQTTPTKQGPVTQGAFIMQTTQPPGEKSNIGHDHASRFRPYVSDPDADAVNQAIAPYKESYYDPGPLASTPSKPKHDRHPHQNSPYHDVPHRNSPHHDIPQHSAIVPTPGYGGSPGYPNNYGYPSNYGYPGGEGYPSNQGYSSVLPDPRPGERTAVMRAGVDPRTGNEVTQAIWSDNVHDPTDPVTGTNPDITRKTINRITTQAGHGDIVPQNTQIVNQLTFNTPLDSSDNSYLTPTTYQRTYGGDAAAIRQPEYAQDYPENDNVAYYLGSGNQASRPVIHEGPARSQAIRDHVTLDSHA